ncbi:hypothetical protein [Streptomyces sp. NPDC058045]|uniref:hypothetical protein n=1 Tax=Streptomyces sp. NPDC058045 TaxID=3346311 RepID=UPI0036EC79D0
MRTRTARGALAAITAVTVLGGAAQAQAAAPAGNNAGKSDPAATPAAYSNYLRHSDEPGADKALAQFKSLTSAQQTKFVGYLHDPEVLRSFIDVAAAQGSGLSTKALNTKSTTSLRNGDVTIGQESAVTGVAASAKKKLGKGPHTVKYNAYVKYFGVKVIKMSLWVNFKSNGHDITKVTSAGAGKINLSGVISLSHTTPKKARTWWRWCPKGKPCSSGHFAEASVIWEGNIAFKGSMFQIDKKQWMQADIYGKVSNRSLTNV